MATKRKAKKAKTKRFTVEFELIDAPGQMLRVEFHTKRRALRFVDFDDDNDLICYAALIEN